MTPCSKSDGGREAICRSQGAAIYIHNGGHLPRQPPIDGQPACHAMAARSASRRPGPEQADAWHAAASPPRASRLKDPPGFGAKHGQRLYLAYCDEH